MNNDQRISALVTMSAKNALLIGTIMCGTIGMASAQVFSPSISPSANGNFGIGNTTNNPTNTLDVDGTARVRTINQDEALNNVLVRDADGVFHWRTAAGIAAMGDNDWLVNGNAMTNIPNNVNLVGTGDLFRVGTGSANSKIRMGTVEFIRDGGGYTIEVGDQHSGQNNSQRQFVPETGCSWNLGSNQRPWDELFLCGTIHNDGAMITGPIVPYGLSQINQLTPRYYTVSSGQLMSFSPTEVSSIIPEAVYDPTMHPRFDEAGSPIAPSGGLMISEMQIIPVMVNAIQELDTKIDACCASHSSIQSQQYEEKINDLEEKVARLEQLIEGLGAESQTFSPADNQEIGTLYQNRPNPFGESTTIRYFIPTGARSATLDIYTMSGVQIASYPIDQKGAGELQVEGHSLKAGSNYMYSLTIDGAIIDTKQMITVGQ